MFVGDAGNHLSSSVWLLCMQGQYICVYKDRRYIPISAVRLRIHQTKEGSQHGQLKNDEGIVCVGCCAGLRCRIAPSPSLSYIWTPATGTPNAHIAPMSAYPSPKSPLGHLRVMHALIIRAKNYYVCMHARRTHDDVCLIICIYFQFIAGCKNPYDRYTMMCMDDTGK